MTQRNALQDMCSGPDFAFGEMYAIREFSVDDVTMLSAGLCAVMQSDARWSPGVNEAICRLRGIPLDRATYTALKSVDGTAQGPSSREPLAVCTVMV